MQSEAKARFVAGLSFFQQAERSGYVLSRTWTFAPVGKKSIAQIFVDHSFVRFDDFLASRDPATTQDRQLVAGQTAAQRRKTFDVGDEQPTRDVGNLADGAFRESGSIFIAYLFRLMEDEYPVADDDLVVIAQSDGLMEASMIQECAITAAQIDQPEFAHVLYIDNRVPTRHFL